MLRIMSPRSLLADTARKGLERQVSSVHSAIVWNHGNTRTTTTTTATATIRQNALASFHGTTPSFAMSSFHTCTPLHQAVLLKMETTRRKKSKRSGTREGGVTKSKSDGSGSRSGSGNGSGTSNKNGSRGSKGGRGRGRGRGRNVAKNKEKDDSSSRKTSETPQPLSSSAAASASSIPTSSSRQRKYIVGDDGVTKDLRKEEQVDPKSGDRPLPYAISLDSDWQLPIEIRAAMKEDPTYFHGRDGLASQWTEASHSLSPALLKIFAQIRREQELKSLEDDDDDA